MAPLVRLFAFRIRDPVTGKWMRARYKAAPNDIARRYATFELLGEPDIHGSVPGGAGHVQRAHDPGIVRAEESPAPANKPGATTRLVHSDVELHPQRQTSPGAIDDDERRYVAMFLRRYITYNARRGRYAAMGGAAMLFRELHQPMENQPCYPTNSRNG